MKMLNLVNVVLKPFVIVTKNLKITININIYLTNKHNFYGIKILILPH